MLGPLNWFKWAGSLWTLSRLVQKVCSEVEEWQEARVSVKLTHYRSSASAFRSLKTSPAAR